MECFSQLDEIDEIFNFSDDGILKSLVHHGAFVGGDRCCVASFQWSALELDFVAVERLLTSGLDPNDVGKLTEPAHFGYEFIHYTFLHGKTPLDCCRYIYIGSDWKRHRGEELRAVEKLLKDHGAVDLEANSHAAEGVSLLSGDDRQVSMTQPKRDRRE